MNDASDAQTREMIDAVERVRSGDVAAYRILVERFQGPLFRVLRRYVEVEDDAMDLVQRALVKAYERLDDLAEPAAFRGWLFRIGVNLALNQRRAAGRRKAEALDEVGYEPQVEATAERVLVHKGRMSRVQEALDALTPTQRDVVLLRLEGELTCAEIAEQIDSTPGSVRVHYHNAVKRLRKLLGGDGPDSVDRLEAVTRNPKRATS